MSQFSVGDKVSYKVGMGSGSGTIVADLGDGKYVVKTEAGKRVNRRAGSLTHSA